MVSPGYSSSLYKCPKLDCLTSKKAIIGLLPIKTWPTSQIEKTAQIYIIISILFLEMLCFSFSKQISSRIWKVTTVLTSFISI